METREVEERGREIVEISERGRNAVDEALIPRLDVWLSHEARGKDVARVFGRVTNTLRKHILSQMSGQAMVKDFWVSWWATRGEGDWEILSNNPGFKSKQAASLTAFIVHKMVQGGNEVRLMEAADMISLLRIRHPEVVDERISPLWKERERKSGRFSAALSAALIAIDSWPETQQRERGDEDASSLKEEVWASAQKTSNLYALVKSQGLLRNAPIVPLGQFLRSQIIHNREAISVLAERPDVWKSGVILKEILVWEDLDIMESLMGTVPEGAFLKRFERVIRLSPGAAGVYLQAHPEKLLLLSRKQVAHLLAFAPTESRMAIIRHLGHDDLREKESLREGGVHEARTTQPPVRRSGR